MNGIEFSFALDDAQLGALAKRVAHLLSGEGDAAADAWPEWMNVETLARYLDCSPERIRKLVARREIPFAQEAAGCRISFCRRSIDEWLRDVEIRERTYPSRARSARTHPSMQRRAPAAAQKA